MSFRKKAEEFKGELEKRHKESAERKDESGMSSSNIFNMETLKEFMPNGVNIWRPVEGTHEIDIIPFFAGSQHPRDREGIPSYCVDVWVYQRVGALKLQFVSPSKTWKQTDPVIEYIHRENLSKEEFKAKAAKRRVIYEIWCHDNKEEEDKGIQVWDVAHFFMEKHLDVISKSPDDGGYIQFSHHNTGCRVLFDITSEGKWTDETGTERDSVSYIGHRFRNRPKDTKIPDVILDMNFPLDEAIHMKPSYAEIYEAFYGKKYIEDGTTVQADPPSRLVRKLSKETPPEEEPPDDETPDDETPDDNTCPDGGIWGGECDKRDACGSCEVWDACSDAAITFNEPTPPDEPTPPKKTTAVTGKKKPIIRRKK